MVFFKEKKKIVKSRQIFFFQKNVKSRKIICQIEVSQPIVQFEKN